MRCPEDVAVMTGFSSGGFGASSGHLIRQEVSKKDKSVKIELQE
jgi:hypothetical protein